VLRYFVLNVVAIVKYVVANICISYLNDVLGWNENKNMVYFCINITENFSLAHKV
jgi:hypothetical protein